MTHCRLCGGELDRGRPARCRICGAVDWGNAKPCAAALVVLDGRVLLTQRAHAPWQGLWCAPSGFCDGPEHPILTAEREAREETGLAVRVVGHLGTWISPYADDPASDDEHVSVQYFAAVLLDPPDAAAPDPTEVAALGWFDPADPPAALAPPTALASALSALRAALAGPGLSTPLPDRPPAA